MVEISTPSLRASNGCVEAWQSTGGAMVMQYGLLRGESARNDGGFVKSSSLVLFAQMWKQQHIAYVWIVGKQHHQAV